MDFYESLSDFTAESWWKAMIDIFEEEFKKLSATELSIIGNLILKKFFNEHKGTLLLF